MGFWLQDRGSAPWKWWFSSTQSLNLSWNFSRERVSIAVCARCSFRRQPSSEGNCRSLRLHFCFLQPLFKFISLFSSFIIVECVEAALWGSLGPLLWETVALEVLCHGDFGGAKVLGVKWATRWRDRVCRCVVLSLWFVRRLSAYAAMGLYHWGIYMKFVQSQGLFLKMF